VKGDFLTGKQTIYGGFSALLVWMFLSIVSGRSSAIGDVTVDSTTTGAHSDVGSIGGGVTGHGETSVGAAVTLDSDSLEADYDFNHHVHVLRLRILDRLIYYLPELRDVGGVRAIPFMQVSHVIRFNYLFALMSIFCMLYHSFKICVSHKFFPPSTAIHSAAL